MIFILVVISTLITFSHCELPCLRSPVVLNVKETPGNPDGFPRQVYSIYHKTISQTRPFPGPCICATQGETVEVTVVNSLLTETTSLHFHGLNMERNAWMDGVVGITECGIAPGTNFTYKFQVTQTGTLLITL